MLRDTTQGGGGHDGPFCLACRQPIVPAEQAKQIVFVTDRHGYKGLTGTYHPECGKPFASMARTLEMMSRPIG